MEDRYAEVLALAGEGRDFPVAVAWDPDAVADAVAAVADAVDIPPVDAEIVYDPAQGPSFSLREESWGRKTDVEGTLTRVLQRIEAGDWGEVPLQVRPLAPQITAEDLTIVDFSTSIAGNTANRAHNVCLALSKVDGYVLKPGETFSFNEVVGNRTAESGFLAAPVINGDKALVPGIGGGTCQASTTVYNAALRAGLEIVERHHHSFPVGYVEKGLDATVSWGTQDVKFTNPRETPVFFRTYFENDNVHVVIYGEPFPHGGEYRCWSEVTGTVSPPAPVSRADASLPPGQSVNYVKSRCGYRVTAYRDYYENGVLVERSVLHRDYYRPIRGIVLVGPSEEAEHIMTAAE